MIFRKKSLILIVMISVSGIVFAQEEDDLGTEVVNIVKPYTPTISDAFKVKETPVLNDSTTTQKRKVQYEIFSVPVASTFTPAKGKATTVEKAKPITVYDNYATLGFGNYTTILGELFSSFEISRTDNASVFFRHNSAQGAIEDVLLDTKYYDTELSGSYSSRQRDLSYKLDAGINHQVFNWYGLPNGSFSQDLLASIDPKQTYLGVNLGGNISVEESVFEGASAKVYYLSDAFSSSEVNAILQPSFRFPLTDFDLILQGELDYLTGSFERSYLSPLGINYGFLNAGVAPSIVYKNEDLTLSLGAQAVVSLDTENSETGFYIYPNIDASYRLVDEILIAYAGVEGGLDQNTYREMKNENPFVSPTLFLAPTSQLYNGFVGLKGKLTNQIGYNVRGSYGKEENRAFFQKNVGNLTNVTREGYEYGNSFALVYDDLNTLNIFGELKVEVSEAFQLGAQANFYSYSLDQQPEAWNLPMLEATVFSDFTITEKIYGGVSLFFVGERKDIGFNGIETLDSFFDANVNVGYHVNERLSIFAKGSNLLGNNYERWLDFPVQGIQGLLGATYKFDW